MNPFDQAWEIAKMGYPGMPLDETSVYYDTIRERLGLGEPFNTGEQRRVFNIPGQPNFVAKVVNDGETDRNTPFEFGGRRRDSGFWEDYAYPSLARVIPQTAEKYLLPGETMGLDENISGVVRQPRVNVHPRMKYKDFEPKADAFRDDFLTSARSEISGREHEQAIMDEISDFLREQDYGYGNFTDDMKLLDYYAFAPKDGRVFKE